MLALGVKKLGCCGEYGFLSLGAMSLRYSNDCAEHGDIDILDGNAITISTREFERYLCDLGEFFHTYQWYVNGQPVTQNAALKIYLDEAATPSAEEYEAFVERGYK